MTTRKPPAQDELSGLVLQVAFGREDSARSAWARLEPRLDIDTIAHDTHGVFPQLAASLRALGESPDILARLDGVRRRLWTRNTVRVRQVLGARTALQRSGIDAEVTGGLGVLLLQGDLGLRPLVDAELAVPVEASSPACGILTAEGWSETTRRRDGWLLDLHAVTFAKEGHQVTLRWCDTSWPYSAAVPDQVTLPDGATVPVPGAAELLAYTLIEGFRLWGYTATRRLADAMMLTRDPALVQWPRLAGLVDERHARLPVREGLLAVAAAGTPGLTQVPEVAELTGARVSLRETLVSVSDSHDLGTLSVLLRRTGAMPLRQAAAAAPDLLRDLWELPPGASLPGVGARRLRERRSGRAS